MKGYYSVIQYAPFDRPDERVNLGVAVFGETSVPRVRFKITNDISRALMIDKQAQLLGLESKVHGFEDKLRRERFENKNEFELFCASRANQIRMTQPRYCVSVDIFDAVDELFHACVQSATG
jgi:hypothetical protein